MKNINNIAAKIHKIHAKWWVSLQDGKSLNRNRGELLMLAVTELAEAVEGIRQNLNDDKLKHRKMEEVEMADCYIRLLDFAAGFKIGELEIINEEWMKYSETENKAETILNICGSILEAYYAGKECAREISICISQIIRYCKKWNLDLDSATKEKLEFNKIRTDHKHSFRRLAPGKKF